MSRRQRPRAASEKLDTAAVQAFTGFKLRIVQVLMFDAFYDRFGGRGLTTGAFSTMLAIHTNPGVRQGALARALHVKRSHMTKLVDRLVSEGLVVRSVPADDRRTVVLGLTAAGRDLMEVVAHEVRAQDREATSSLSRAELQELWRLLDKLAGDLAQRRGTADGE